MAETHSTTPELIDFKINVKHKLAALWTSLMFLYIYTDFFNMMTPGAIEGMMKQESPIDAVTPGMLVIFSMILIVPSIMIVLSLTLKARSNRWANIIVGAIWSFMSLLILVTDLIGANKWSLFYDLYQVVEIILFGAIIWNAWKWPRAETS